MKNKFILILTLFCCIIFAGCSSAGAISTYTISLDSIPKNFDPQVASEENELMVLSNIYDGLFELRDGKAVPNVCESYDISSDGLTYTFKLRTDSTFYLSKKEQIPVTSADFAFALERVLDKSTHSPYYNDFKHINSISTPNDNTLVIKLSHSDSSFITKLCSPAAFPCNKKFFSETNGAYGLRVKDILSNGPYTINYLADDGSYATIIRIDGNKKAISRIRLELSDKESDAVSAYNNDKISGFFSEDGISSNIDGKVFSFENKNFNMMLNPAVKTLSDSDVRGALAYYAFAMENSGANLSAVTQSRSFFCGEILHDGKSIVSQLGNITPSYMSQNPKQLLQQGLNRIQLEQPEKLTVLIPSDISFKVIAENINQLWQKELGLFFTLETIPNSEISSRIKSGDYDIAFVSSKPASSSAATLLQPFEIYGGEIAQHILALQDNSLSASQSLSHINSAHNAIIQQAYIIPMCTDKSEYIHKSFFDNIEISPFGNIINFKYATVK